MPKNMVMPFWLLTEMTASPIVIRITARTISIPWVSPIVTEAIAIISFVLTYIIATPVENKSKAILSGPSACSGTRIATSVCTS